MFTKIRIGNSDTLVLGLAPLSVLPKVQKNGIGGKLIEVGHQIAKDLGYAYSIVLGMVSYANEFFTK